METEEKTNNTPTFKKNWVKAMIEREATPKPERRETTAQFAERYGICESTYNYQKNKKENKKEVIRIWLNEAIDGGNEVLKKLKDNAIAGKEKSIEMYLKFVLELAENLDIKSDGKPIPILTINNVLSNNSDKKDYLDAEEDQGNPGGDISLEDGEHNHILDSVSPIRQEADIN